MERSAAFIPLVLRVCAGPLAWAAHFLGIYALTALSCARGSPQGTWPGIGVVPLAVAVMTVIAAAVIGVALRHPPLARGNPPETRAFLQWISRAFGALALGAIAWQAVPALVVPGCG